MNLNPYEAPNEALADTGNQPAQPPSRTIPAMFVGLLGTIGCLDHGLSAYYMLHMLGDPSMLPLISDERLYLPLVQVLVAAFGSAGWILAAVMIGWGRSWRISIAILVVGLLGQLQRRML